MDTYDYTYKPLTVLALICAGVDQVWGCCLLEKAIIKNDVRFAKIILEHNAALNVNVKISKYGPFCCGEESAMLRAKGSMSSLSDIPLLFGVKTVEMAQALIAHGANVYEINSCDKTNILWNIMDNRYPANLMEFYLAQKVDAITLYTYNEDNLLHRFAETTYVGNIHGIANFIQKAELLLKTIPDQINNCDKYKRMPLDVVLKSLKYAKRDTNKAAKLAFKVLIGLFQEHQALSTDDIAKQRLSTLMEQYKGYSV